MFEVIDDLHLKMQNTCSPGVFRGHYSPVVVYDLNYCFNDDLFVVVY